MDFSALFDALSDRAATAFEEGEILLFPESRASSILVVAEGTVEISRYDRDGRRLLQSILAAPQCLGLIESLAKTEILSGVRALTAGRYYAVDARDAVFRDPAVLALLLRYLAALHVQEMERRASEKNLSPEDLLLYTFYRAAEPPFPFTFPFTRADLADLTGLSLRSLYRHLGALEREGFISRSGGRIQIDAPSYRRIALRLGEVL